MKPSPEDVVRAIYDAAEKGLRVVVVAGPGAGVVELGAQSLAALEEVQVNVAGQGGLATENTLAALLDRLTPGTPEQHAGNVGTTPEPVNFAGPTKHVIVLNPDLGAKLEVSFDGGTSFLAVPDKGCLSVPGRVTGVQVRAGMGTVVYGILAMV